jgi:hypothetical protein
VVAPRNWSSNNHPAQRETTPLPAQDSKSHGRRRTTPASRATWKPAKCEVVHLVDSFPLGNQSNLPSRLHHHAIDVILPAVEGFKSRAISHSRKNPGGLDPARIQAPGLGVQQWRYLIWRTTAIPSAILAATYAMPIRSHICSLYRLRVCG